MCARLSFLIVLVVAWCSTRAALGDEKTVNLLQLPAAAVERTSLPGGTAGDLKALTDGDPSLPLVLDVADGEPLSIVYGFGGGMVTLERLVVAVPAGRDAAPPERIELLVSLVSPHAGFQSVRSEALRPATKPGEFDFKPIGAKWVMLRFTPAAKSVRMAIGDVGVLGHVGPPVSRYKFNESPARAFDVLQRLEKNSALKLEISRDEADLFDDAQDGKLERWSFAEAALMASGVPEADRRKKYLAGLDEIEAGARQAVAAARTPFDRGQALLKHLHSGPLAKGYVAKQTNVSTILDEGTFNCVSSAALYNILGRRLDLDARGIEVPDHAFSILYDGIRHADVETTTAGGFNPARDRAAQDEFTRLTGFAYIPDRHRDQRREIGEAGLVAIIYYNHGVELTAEKRYHEALLAYFRAMSLDREFDSAVKNALAVLANWGVELSREKKFEEALNVVGTGLALAPEDATLVNNHKAVWLGWANALIDAGQSDEALAVLRRAEEAIPGGGFARMQSWVFIRPGEEHVKAGEWNKALAVVEPGLDKLEEGPREELAEWGRNLYHRWAQSEQKKARFREALDVLEKGVQAAPADDQFPRHVAYVVQEWARSAHEKDGVAAGEQVVAEVLQRFPQMPAVRQTAKSHCQRVVQELIGKQRYDEALAAAEREGKLLDDGELTRDLSRAVYDGWTRGLTAAKKWQEAIDVYTSSLTRFPGDKHLENNLLATWDDWAASYSRAKDWPNAVDVYEKALGQLTDTRRAENNIKFFVQEWGKDVYAKEGVEAATAVLVKQVERFSTIDGVRDVAGAHVRRVVQDLAGNAKYDEALAAAEAGKNLLKDDAELAQVAGGVYDTWAGAHRAKQEWQAAVDVYAKGLEKFPGERRLEQNAVATWYQWAKTYMDAKDWPAAIAVYEKALLQFPSNGVLKNNIEFCRQQLVKEKS
ncbi:MAG: hypothetical protein WD069_16205 [Planctomycetales bacterium]